MTDRPDLPRRGREELEALLREHLPNAEVWAHGRSRMNGRCHSGSALDLVLRSPTLEPLGTSTLKRSHLWQRYAPCPPRLASSTLGKHS